MTQLTADKTNTAWDAKLARESVQAYAQRPGALIEALHKIQELFGYVPDEGIILLAELFNLSRADVHGVTSFYHDFKRSKSGRQVVKICQAEACQAMGSEKLTEEIKAHLGAGFHETTADGNFTLEPVYCLGNCACSPNIMVGKQVHARMNIERFRTLTESLVKEAK